MKLSMTPLVAAMLASSTVSAGSVRSKQRVLNELVDSDHAADMTEKVLYSCDVSSSWSSANQPIDYPSTAHTSPPVLVAHGAGYKMFTPGEVVSAPVQVVAETGDPTDLIAELETAVGAGTVMSYIVGGAMWFDGIPAARKLAKSPGEAIDGREQTIGTPLTFTPDMPYFTSIAMLAPSPDWFSSSHGLSAVNDAGFWYKSFTLETKPYDAGTDSGLTFMAADLATDPKVGAQQFTTTAPADEAAAGIFQNTAMDDVPAIMKWACTIESVMYDCEKKPDAEGCDNGSEDGSEDGNDSDEESAAPSTSFAALALSSLMAGAYLLL